MTYQPHPYRPKEWKGIHFPFDWQREYEALKAEGQRVLNEAGMNAPADPTHPRWLDIAAEVTSGDRQRDYGRPLKNFLRWALVDNIMDAGRRNKGDYKTPIDEAHNAINLKQVRDWNMFKDDNWVDTMGYSATVDDMNRQMQELGYQDGVKAFKRMDVGEMYAILDRIIREEADSYSAS